MATITKRILGGSTDGFPIVVSSTAVSGTLIHLGPSNTNTIDKITLYAYSSATAAVTVWIEFGNAASASQRMTFDIPPGIQSAVGGVGDGLTCLFPGLLLQGRSLTAASINIGASTSMVISLYGEVERIVQS